VAIPLAPRTARAIDVAIGERTDGPVFLAADGRRLDRHGAGTIVRKTARRAGIGRAVTPHTLRHMFITAALDAGVPLRDVQEVASHADLRTTMRYDRARGSLYDPVGSADVVEHDVVVGPHPDSPSLVGHAGIRVP
jgi:integrase/recombinase XerD